MSWDRDFAGLPPIELPDGRKLETLSGAYILARPAKQRKSWGQWWPRRTSALKPTASEAMHRLCRAQVADRPAGRRRQHFTSRDPPSAAVVAILSHAHHGPEGKPDGAPAPVQGCDDMQWSPRRARAGPIAPSLTAMHFGRAYLRSSSKCSRSTI